MMNKTNLFIFLACLFTVLAGVGCTSSVHSGRGELQDRNKRLYQTLDSLIDSQASIIQEKEARIRIISEGMKASINDELRYETYKRLYEEYLAFRFDSAFVYISTSVWNCNSTLEIPTRQLRTLSPWHIYWQ